MVWAMEYEVAVTKGGVYTVDVKGGTIIVVVEERNTRGIEKGGIVMAKVAGMIVMAGVIRIVMAGVNGEIVIAKVTSMTIMAGVISGKMTSNHPSSSIILILNRLKNSFKLFSDCSILA